MFGGFEHYVKYVLSIIFVNLSSLMSLDKMNLLEEVHLEDT